MPLSIRAFSSSRDWTRICRRKVRAILPNRVSTMFSHEPCFGVRTYWRRLGCLDRNACVSLENVSGMIVQNDSDGAFRRVLRMEVGQQANEFDTAVAVLHARRDLAILEIQRCQYGT